MPGLKSRDSINLRHCIVLFLLLSCTPASAGNCQFETFNWSFTSDSHAHWIVKSGATCGLSLTMTGGGITDMHIAQAAQHGTVGFSGNYHCAYKSQPGFVGKDSYVIQISGEQMFSRVIRGTSNITVNVDVVP